MRIVVGMLACGSSLMCGKSGPLFFLLGTIFAGRMIFFLRGMYFVIPLRQSLYDKCRVPQGRDCSRLLLCSGPVLPGRGIDRLSKPIH